MSDRYHGNRLASVNPQILSAAKINRFGAARMFCESDPAGSNTRRDPFVKATPGHMDFHCYNVTNDSDGSRISHRGRQPII